MLEEKGLADSPLCHFLEWKIIMLTVTSLLRFVKFSDYFHDYISFVSQKTLVSFIESANSDICHL